MVLQLFSTFVTLKTPSLALKTLSLMRRYQLRTFCPFSSSPHPFHFPLSIYLQVRQHSSRRFCSSNNLFNCFLLIFRNKSALLTGGNNFLAIIFQFRNHSVAFIISYFVSGFQTPYRRTDDTHHLNLQCSPPPPELCQPPPPSLCLPRRDVDILTPIRARFSLPTSLSLCRTP